MSGSLILYLIKRYIDIKPFLFTFWSWSKSAQLIFNNVYHICHFFSRNADNNAIQSTAVWLVIFIHNSNVASLWLKEWRYCFCQLLKYKTAWVFFCIPMQEADFPRRYIFFTLFSVQPKTVCASKYICAFFRE